MKIYKNMYTEERTRVDSVCESRKLLYRVVQKDPATLLKFDKLESFQIVSLV